jgi:hypothetical protein
MKFQFSEISTLLRNFFIQGALEFQDFHAKDIFFPIFPPTGQGLKDRIGNRLSYFPRKLLGFLDILLKKSVNRVINPLII